MRRLRADEKLVNGGAIFLGHDAEIDAEPQHGKQVQYLLGGNGIGMDHDAVGAADLVGDHPALVLEHFLARVFLVLHHLLDDLGELVDDVASDSPRVIWLEIWKRLPSASVPSP